MSELAATTLQTLHYDAQDRIQQTRTGPTTGSRRFYRHSELVGQTTAGTTIAYLREANSLLAVLKNNTAQMIGTDQQGSVVRTDGGAQGVQFSYTAHGFNPTPDLLGYCGEATDPVTGCYLLGNGYRAYEPATMRFRSPDSFSPFGAGGINPYAYCRADPINRSDPTGHLDWIGWVNIGFTVLGFALTLYSASAALPAFAALTAKITGGAVGATRGAAATASSIAAAASVTAGTTSTAIQIAGAAIFGSAGGDPDQIQLARYLGVVSGALTLISSAAAFTRFKFAAREAKTALEELELSSFSPLNSETPGFAGRNSSWASLPNYWSPASPAAPSGGQLHDPVLAATPPLWYRAATRALAVEAPQRTTQSTGMELRTVGRVIRNTQHWASVFDPRADSQV